MTDPTTTDPLSAEPGSARRLMADIVSESYPADLPVWRAGGRSLTGAEMAREILAGTETGREYATAALRVCRDLLARQARRDADGERTAEQADGAGSPGPA